jgi:hypothetical protein
MTTLQMRFQAWRGEELHWTHQKYAEDNHVENDDQMNMLDLFQEELRNGTQADDAGCELSRDHDRHFAAQGFADGATRVFSRDTIGQLIVRKQENGAWDDAWTSQGGSITRGPAVIALDDALDLRIYARATDGRLLEGVYQNDTMISWKSLGGNMDSSPTAVRLGRHGIRVYARNGRNQLEEKAWYNGERQPWTSLEGGEILGDPSAISVSMSMSMSMSPESTFVSTHETDTASSWKGCSTKMCGSRPSPWGQGRLAALPQPFASGSSAFASTQETLTTG